MINAINLIQSMRDKLKKRFTLDGFDTQTGGEITEAAMCYATVGGAMSRGASRDEWPVSMFDGFNDSIVNWPWDHDHYTPASDAQTNLVIAAALLIEEIDRLQRQATPHHTSTLVHAVQEHLKNCSPEQGIEFWPAVTEFCQQHQAGIKK